MFGLFQLSRTITTHVWSICMKKQKNNQKEKCNQLQCIMMNKNMIPFDLKFKIFRVLFKLNFERIHYNNVEFKVRMNLITTTDQLI